MVGCGHPSVRSAGVPPGNPSSDDASPPSVPEWQFEIRGGFASCLWAEADLSGIALAVAESDRAAALCAAVPPAEGGGTFLSPSELDGLGIQLLVARHAQDRVFEAGAVVAVGDGFAVVREETGHLVVWRAGSTEPLRLDLMDCCPHGARAVAARGLPGSGAILVEYASGTSSAVCYVDVHAGSSWILTGVPGAHCRMMFPDIGEDAVLVAAEPVAFCTEDAGSGEQPVTRLDLTGTRRRADMLRSLGVVPDFIRDGRRIDEHDRLLSAASRGRTGQWFVYGDAGERYALPPSGAAAAVGQGWFLVFGRDGEPDGGHRRTWFFLDSRGAGRRSLESLCGSLPAVGMGAPSEVHSAEPLAVDLDGGAVLTECQFAASWTLALLTPGQPRDGVQQQIVETSEGTGTVLVGHDGNVAVVGLESRGATKRVWITCRQPRSCGVPGGGLLVDLGSGTCGHVPLGWSPVLSARRDAAASIGPSRVLLERSRTGELDVWGEVPEVGLFDWASERWVWRTQRQVGRWAEMDPGPPGLGSGGWRLVGATRACAFLEHTRLASPTSPRGCEWSRDGGAGETGAHSGTGGDGWSGSRAVVVRLEDGAMQDVEAGVFAAGGECGAVLRGRGSGSMDTSQRMEFRVRNWLLTSADWIGVDEFCSVGQRLRCPRTTAVVRPSATAGKVRDVGAVSSPTACRSRIFRGAGNRDGFEAGLAVRR